MNISVENSSNKELTIKIKGRFDYSLHKDFRNAYRDLDPSLIYHVDVSNTEYLDSSALGMLLLLKKHADGGEGKVIIESPQPEVKKVLNIANFDKVFEIR